MSHRAHALLVVKTLDAELRTIEGVATSISPDRLGDIVEPRGALFTLPLPLLYQHNRNAPIGHVTHATVTADGIKIKAQIARGVLPFIDDAWALIKAGLVRGLSIGFRPHDAEAIPRSTGVRYKSWEWLELSAVTVPAHADASIALVRSLDAQTLVETDERARRHTPGDTGNRAVSYRSKVPTMTKTYAERIASVEASITAKTAELDALQTKVSDEDRTKNQTERDRFDATKGDIDDLVKELSDLRSMEAINMQRAVVVDGSTSAHARDARDGGVRSVQIKSTVPKGTAFVRAVCAKLVCNGNMHEAAEYAKRWDDTTPEVSLYLKAAMAPGTTTDAAWAAPLVNQNISADFLELLRPATILGRIAGLRNVPFDTKVPSQTAGGTYGWVGESKPKPVTKLAFSSESLGMSKAAGIIVLTEELVRLSNPSAEALVRDDMIKGIAQFLDAQFIDPAVAAVANVNPASITNGAPTAAASTNPLADIMGLINHFATNNIDVSGVHFILSAANALSLSFRSNLDGSPEFPGVGINGGSYRGLTFVTSNAAGGNVIALQPGLILYADDGGVTIDVSREASLQMDSAPASPADATTVYVSLWQTNTVGLRAERWINWKRANANAVKYLTATACAAPAAAMTREHERAGRAEPTPPRS